mmetsp:Transcript_63115/g.136640  ORF Transcript_63115/g.136640 Transcript_63115/m.136640 type:complete len:331 (+) Transcript_63115:2-994(+)
MAAAATPGAMDPSWSRCSRRSLSWPLPATRTRISDMTTVWWGSDSDVASDDASDSETTTCGTRGNGYTSRSGDTASSGPSEEQETNAQQEASENSKNKLQARTNELLAQTNVLLASDPAAMRQHHGDVDAATLNESEDDRTPGWDEMRWDRPIGWGVPFPFPARKTRPPRPVAEDRRTSVVIRNFPTDFTRAKVATMLNKEGFARQYNFLYVPINFRTGNAFGWAFINLVHPRLVPDLWQKFDGYQNWPTEGHGPCTVAWSKPHQGLGALVDHYRNSKMMHQDVPDEQRPACFYNGMRVVFPPPTQSMKAPPRRSRIAREEVLCPEAAEP